MQPNVTPLELESYFTGDLVSQSYEAEVNVAPDLRIDDDPDAHSWIFALHGQSCKLVLRDFDGFEQISLLRIVHSPCNHASDRVFEGLHLHANRGSRSSLVRVILYWLGEAHRPIQDIELKPGSGNILVAGGLELNAIEKGPHLTARFALALEGVEVIDGANEVELA